MEGPHITSVVGRTTEPRRIVPSDRTIVGLPSPDVEEEGRSQSLVMADSSRQRRMILWRREMWIRKNFGCRVLDGRSGAVEEVGSGEGGGFMEKQIPVGAKG
jgi:hypothetical protein